MPNIRYITCLLANKNLNRRQTVTSSECRVSVELFIYLQPKPHFQPSSKRGPTPTTSSVTAGSVEQPPSYADFIVQRKKDPPAAPLKESSSKPPWSADAATTEEHSRSSSVSTVTGGLEASEKCAQGNDGDSDVIQKSEIQPERRTHPQEGSCPKSDTGISLGPRPVGSGSSIIVSPRQVSSICALTPEWFLVRN